MARPLSASMPRPRLARAMPFEASRWRARLDVADRLVEVKVLMRHAGRRRRFGDMIADALRPKFCLGGARSCWRRHSMLMRFLSSAEIQSAASPAGGRGRAEGAGGGGTAVTPLALSVVA